MCSANLNYILQSVRHHTITTTTMIVSNIMPEDSMSGLCGGDCIKPNLYHPRG